MRFAGRFRMLRLPGAALRGQLHELGFDVLNQANNHALDFGPAAQQQTLESVRL